MNQSYAEAGVKRKDTPATMGLRALYILGIFCGIIILFTGSVFGIIGAAVIVLVFYMFPRLNVEYEYVYCDGQLDFDKISGKVKRKHLIRIDFEQADIMAPLNSHALDGYTHMNNIEVKDFTSRDKDSKVFVIIASHGEKKAKILFEPSETMIASIKQKCPRKVVLF